MLNAKTTKTEPTQESTSWVSSLNLFAVGSWVHFLVGKIRCGTCKYLGSQSIQRSGSWVYDHPTEKVKVKSGNNSQRKRISEVNNSQLVC